MKQCSSEKKKHTIIYFPFKLMKFSKANDEIPSIRKNAEIIIFVYFMYSYILKKKRYTRSEVRGA